MRKLFIQATSCRSLIERFINMLGTFSIH